MPANSPQTLELRNRMVAMSEQQQRWLKAGLWLLLVLPVVAIIAFVLLGVPGTLDWRELMDRVSRAVARDPWNGAALLLAAVASVLHLAYLKLAIRRERIILTQFEIRYESPLPQALRFLRPGWALRWSELSRARLVKNQALSGPLSAALVLETVYGTRKLRPYQWIEPETFVAQSPWQLMRQASSMRGEDLERAIAESPLMQFVATRVPRIETRPGWAGRATAYRLEDSPRAVALTALFVMFVAYGVVDAYVNAETYAGHPPYFVFAASGVLAGGLAWIWLRAGEVPSRERGIVAFLFGSALAAALYPGLLRVNQLTDTGGLQAYRYTLEADLTLSPPRLSMPVLKFPHDFDYWSRFASGSLHEFRLRRGGLGFYQIDMAPVNEALRRYYRGGK